MTLSEFSRSRRRSSHRTVRNPISIYTVPVDRDEGSTLLERQLIDHDKVESRTMKQAKEVQSHLDSQFPSFVKSMLPSIVSGGFTLDIPQRFCKFLPSDNVMISLIDENEEIYTVKYLAVEGRISAGWKSFSNEHELVNGDALIFHLVKATAFKVYIIRAYAMADVDGTSGHLNVFTHQKQTESCLRDRRVRFRYLLRSLDWKDQSFSRLCISSSFPLRRRSS